MKIMGTVAAAGVLCAGLTSCGTAVAGKAAPELAPAPSTRAPATPASPAANAPHTGDEAAVEEVFRDYHDALLQRDFTRACSHDTAETDAHLVESLKARGMTAESCEEALDLLYQSPETAAAADAISSGVDIDDITIDGDSATIAWTYPAGGGRWQATSEAHRDEEGWLLVDVTD
jgi:hypothetical protein